MFDHEISIPHGLLAPPQPTIEELGMGFAGEESKVAAAAITSTVITSSKRRDFDLFGQITKV